MIRKIAVVLCMWNCISVTDSRADVVLDWNATLRNVMQTDGILNSPALANPGWSTRTMAMANGAMYDAFQAVQRTHQPLLFNQLAPNASQTAAAAQAAYDIILDCYPQQQNSILDGALAASLGGIADDQAKIDGIALGHSIAQQYILARTGDGADQGLNYIPQAGPGKWRPDPYHLDQVAWGPQYGEVSPFAIGSTSPFVNAIPSIPALNSQEYTDAFEMVRDYGDINSSVRTQQQEEIGLFWAYDRAAMGPPPVLFLRNLEEIAAAIETAPEENARLFAMASVSMADAAIAAWDAKFLYNFWRPVAAIQEAGVGGPGDADGNPDTVGILDWRPLGAPGDNPNDHLDDFTPPFPAWTSGHATMGGAVFKAIELFFGTNDFGTADANFGSDDVTLNYELTSQEFGTDGTANMSRFFTRFTQVNPLLPDMEDSPEGENGMSRIYLGIHWIFDQGDGITLGNDIAGYVFANRFQAVPEPGAIALGLLAAIGGGLFGQRRVRSPLWPTK
jgi:hypothetical protein